MNYSPFVGYWFIGAATAQERAAYFCSWGLLDYAPIIGLVIIPFVMFYRRLRVSS